jgi:hypothetical protein
VYLAEQVDIGPVNHCYNIKIIYPRLMQHLGFDTTHQLRSLWFTEETGDCGVVLGTAQ